MRQQQRGEQGALQPRAFGQDGPLAWLDWPRADADLMDFVRRLLALRREAEPLRSVQWWPAAPAEGGPSLHWRTPEGGALSADDWQRSDRQALAILFDAPSPTPRWLVLVNAGAGPETFVLPAGEWTCVLASDDPGSAGQASRPLHEATLPPSSLWVART